MHVFCNSCSAFRISAQSMGMHMRTWSIDAIGLFQCPVIQQSGEISPRSESLWCSPRWPPWRL